MVCFAYVSFRAKEFVIVSRRTYALKGGGLVGVPSKKQLVRRHAICLQNYRERKLYVEQYSTVCRVKPWFQKRVSGRANG